LNKRKPPALTGADGFLVITVRQAALAPEVCWYTATAEAPRISPTTALTRIAVLLGVPIVDLHESLRDPRL
jgi:hypothetical protein